MCFSAVNFFGIPNMKNFLENLSLALKESIKPFFDNFLLKMKFFSAERKLSS